MYYLTKVFFCFSTSSKTFTSDGNDYVSFKLTIDREPLYFTFNVALPILLIGLLNGFVFVMPAESGERVGEFKNLLRTVVWKVNLERKYFTIMSNLNNMHLTAKERLTPFV